MKRKPLTEDSIHRKILASCRPPAGSFNSHSLVVGMGDDAALFRPKAGNETILTCDWFLEGTHFLRDKHPPDSIGWKCLARAVSDIAAIGGTPRCFLLSLALPASLTGRWLDGFLAGLRRASRKFGCVLAGGDTTRRDEVLINVAVVGEVKAGRAVLRSGARAGDTLYASGRLGEAELGLRILKQSRKLSKARNPLTRRHLYPEPRVALGQWLADSRLASSMMDLSDGLSSDLPRLCIASGVGARLEMARIPRVRIPAQAHLKGMDSNRLALHGGDDYELLFTVTPHQVQLVPASFQGVPLTSIGTITRNRQIVIMENGGRKRQLVASGWDPFQEKTQWTCCPPNWQSE
jgi:thiamine-monophosphate kinase